MMWDSFLAALGLMLVFEGILPFLSPDRWRNFASILSAKTDRSLRVFGLVCMLIGVALVAFVHAAI